jgi:hypothetical protein
MQPSRYDDEFQAPSESPCMALLSLDLCFCVHSNSLFETLLNDSYNGGQSASSSLDAAINSLGNNLCEW